jgi:hypothetical protein
MNTSIYSTAPYITIDNSSVVPYISPGTPSAGLVRYYGNEMQVYDGAAWLKVISSVNIGLTPVAVDAIEWAHKKMLEEAEARRMAEQYPAVADALGSVREAEQQLKMVVALCRA